MLNSLQTDSEEVIHGKALPALGLGADAKLSDIISKISDRLENIEKILNKELFPPVNDKPITTDDIISPAAPVTLRSDALALKESSLDYEVKKSETDVEITYDAHVSNLPPGSQVLATSVTISGQKRFGRTQIAATKKPRMTASIAYSRFPVTLDARVRVGTPTGDVELTRKVQVSSDEQGAFSQPYEVKDLSPVVNAASLTEVIAQMDQRLKNIERKI